MSQHQMLKNMINQSLFFSPFSFQALGPVRCSSVQVQFDDLVRTVRLFDEWDLHQCRNCRCCVFAGFAGTPASSADKPASCLVNASLVVRWILEMQC